MFALRSRLAATGSQEEIWGTRDPPIFVQVNLRWKVEPPGSGHSVSERAGSRDRIMPAAISKDRRRASWSWIWPLRINSSG